MASDTHDDLILYVFRVLISPPDADPSLTVSKSRAKLLSLSKAFDRSDHVLFCAAI